MTIFLLVVAALTVCLLVVITAAMPARQPYSRTELKRRVARSLSAEEDLDRLRAYTGLVTLFRVMQMTLLVTSGFLLVGVYGWGYGVVVALLVAVAYPVIARVKIVQAGAHKLYVLIEPWLLSVVLRFYRTLLFFREPALPIKESVRRVYSSDDLAEVVSHSGDVIGDKERALLSASLIFFDTPVSKVMVPRSSVKTVKKTEFLGPLVLDELHALGHSRLPVIGEDLDHIVGILHLRDLLSLDVRRSVTAEKAMDKKVRYIHENDTLEAALTGFMKQRHHFYIVTDDEGKTAGIVTLEDVIGTLIGRDIIHEATDDA